MEIVLLTMFLVIKALVEVMTRNRHLHTCTQTAKSVLVPLEVRSNSMRWPFSHHHNFCIIFQIFGGTLSVDAAFFAGVVRTKVLTSLRIGQLRYIWDQLRIFNIEPLPSYDIFLRIFGHWDIYDPSNPPSGDLKLRSLKHHLQSPISISHADAMQSQKRRFSEIHYLADHPTLLARWCAFENLRESPFSAQFGCSQCYGTGDEDSIDCKFISALWFRFAENRDKIGPPHVQVGHHF